MPRRKSCLPATSGDMPLRKRTGRIPQQARGTSSPGRTRHNSANGNEWGGHAGDSGFAELWTTSEIWPPAPETTDPGVLTIRRQIEELLEEKHLREAIGDVFAD